MKKAIGLALATASFGAAAAEWSDISTKADFRFRNENYSVEDGDSHTRQRIRARVDLGYNVKKDMHFHLRLATGTGSATSTNQDLDGNNDKSGLLVDRAYVGQHWGDVHLHAGIMKNYYTRIGGTQVIFDSDVNLEGIHTSYSKHGAYVNFGSFTIDAQKASEGDNDVQLLASQLGYKGDAGMVKYHVGASNYHYQGAHAANIDSTNEGINIVELYGAVKFDLKVPVKLYVTSITNNEAEDDNTASAYGIKIGKAKKAHDWSLGFESRTTESNAVFGELNDGSFAGKNDNSTGTVITAKYKTCDKSALKLTMYSNTQNVDESNEAAFSQTHLDYIVKF